MHTHTRTHTHASAHAHAHTHAHTHAHAHAHPHTFMTQILDTHTHTHTHAHTHNKHTQHTRTRTHTHTHTHTNTHEHTHTHTCKQGRMRIDRTPDSSALFQEDPIVPRAIIEVDTILRPSEGSPPPGVHHVTFQRRKPPSKARHSHKLNSKPHQIKATR